MFKKILFFFLVNQITVSQEFFDFDFYTKVSREKKKYSNSSFNNKIPFNFKFSTKFFLNSSYRNLENLNGKFALKGLTNYSSALFYYKNQNLFLSVEPQQVVYIDSPNYLPNKSEPFNDNLTIKDLSSVNLLNFGLYVQQSGVRVGYGNWNNWSGPGIHNSLTLSNNADGIPALFISTSKPLFINDNLKFNYKYSVSDNLVNNNGIDYFISFSEFAISYKNTQIGINKMILSGGSEDISWKFTDAIKTIYSSKNMKHWDVITDIYISTEFINAKMIAFIEIGGLNQSSIFTMNNVYQNHTQASIFGVRKYGIGKYINLLWGFEHTRTIQGPHYDVLPTPNWYSNKKYNYSKFNKKLWGAHSGSDSDDILLYLGYMNDNSSVIFGYNYERHGVTYHFPPEVKLEQRLLITKKINNFFIKIYYETEVYENYGFLNSNENIWNEINEPGSIQRTKTLTFSIDKKLF